jgi:hypothetical protein
MKPTRSSENKRWVVTCQEAADGTGDLIIPLPADLLTEMGLEDGDSLYITEAYACTHKSLVLSKTATTPDRIASVCHLAEEVFESKESAASWMSRPNKTLGGSTPIILCETEIGAKQVRRVLQALESGGVA